MGCFDIVLEFRGAQMGVEMQKKRLSSMRGGIRPFLNFTITTPGGVGGLDLVNKTPAHET